MWVTIVWWSEREPQEPVSCYRIVLPPSRRLRRTRCIRHTAVFRIQIKLCVVRIRRHRKYQEHRRHESVKRVSANHHFQPSNPDTFSNNQIHFLPQNALSTRSPCTSVFSFPLDSTVQSWRKYFVVPLRTCRWLLAAKVCFTRFPNIFVERKIKMKSFLSHNSC